MCFTFGVILDMAFLPLETSWHHYGQVHWVLLEFARVPIAMDLAQHVRHTLMSVV
jgi:hypothetical protein